MNLRELLPEPNLSTRRLTTVGQVRNPYPAFLYKYRTGTEAFLDRLIVHSELYYSHRADFNDPFDTRCDVVYEGTGAARRLRFKQLTAENKISFKKRNELWAKLSDPDSGRQLAQESFDAVADGAGIHSLAETPRSLLMWAHYASEHKGVCLQFYPPNDLSLFREAFPVVYSGDFPRINWMTDLDREEGALRAYLTKSFEWRYEEEWRLFLRGRTRASQPFAPGALVGVIYGARCPPETVMRVQGMIDRRAKNGHPRLYEWQATLSPKHYGIGIFSRGSKPPKRWQGRPSSMSKSVARRSENAR